MMKKCFLVCPIGEEGSEIRNRSDELKKYMIAPVCEKYGFELVRIDEQPLCGDVIFDRITEHLLKDDLVIVDITGRNPNVFLEMGYRMAIKKPMILISDKNEYPYPFDISGYSILSYGMTLTESDVFCSRLGRILDSIKDNDLNKSDDQNITDELGAECSTVYRALRDEYQKRRKGGMSISDASRWWGTEEVTKFITPFTFDDLDEIIRALGDKGYLKIQTADRQVMILEMPRDKIL